VDRLAIALYAAGVRSTIRSLAQVPPQQLCSPQKLLVRGPQSAIDVTTDAPVHRFVVRCWNPHPRLLMLRPQLPGRVMARHAADAFGQACWRDPELQVPQAPRPVVAQGPQAVPQQNQDISPTIVIWCPPFFAFPATLGADVDRRGLTFPRYAPSS
jgi:hypothetical protein